MRLVKYRCVHCGNVLLRESTKQWVKSFCDITGKTAHLQRIKRSRKGAK